MLQHRPVFLLSSDSVTAWLLKCKATLLELINYNSEVLPSSSKTARMYGVAVEMIVSERSREVANGSEYGELGKILDELARKRNIRGPYPTANYIRRKTGQGPNGSAWSQIFRGETKYPHPDNIRLFVEAFELSSQERGRLADAYLFLGPPRPLLAA